MKKYIIILLSFFTINLASAQSLGSFYPDFGYHGDFCSTRLTTTNLLSFSSINEDAYLFLGTDTIFCVGFHVYAQDSSFIYFQLPLYGTSGLYNFHIKVDGIDYTCNSCFFLAPPAAYLQCGVYFDFNQNGQIDSGEPFVPNQRVGVYFLGSTQIAQTVYLDSAGYIIDYPIAFPTDYCAEYIQDSAGIYSVSSALYSYCFAANSGVFLYGCFFGVYGNPARIQSIMPNMVDAGDTIHSAVLEMDSLLIGGSQAWGNIQEAILFGPSLINIPVQNFTVLSSTESSFSLILNSSVALGTYSIMMKVSNQLYTCMNCLTIQNPLNAIITNSLNTNIKSLVIYPNPAKSIIRIKFSNPLGQNYQFHINDLFGKTLQSFSSTHETVEVENSELQNGLYVIQMLDNEGLEIGHQRFLFIQE